MYKITVAKMRMLRWMRGKTKIDRIKIECFWEYLGVASIGDKLRETHLRWFGHVQCSPTTPALRKNFSMQADGPPRRRGRLERTSNSRSK